MEKYFVKKIDDKLQLCSRDIVLGDTWYNEGLRDYPKGEVASTNTEVMNAHMCMMGDQDQYSSFKIVGEVSPNAIWVKEGMEFDEDDWDNALPEPYAHFKCPTCNTFH